jgi:hypothetical protein
MKYDATAVENAAKAMIEMTEEKPPNDGVPTLTRSQFDAMPPSKRMAAMKSVYSGKTRFVDEKGRGQPNQPGHPNTTVDELIEVRNSSGARYAETLATLLDQLVALRALDLALESPRAGSQHVRSFGGTDLSTVPIMLQHPDFAPHQPSRRLSDELHEQRNALVESLRD